MNAGRMRGFALVAVAWVLALVLAIATSVAAALRTDVQSQAAFLAAAQARHAAEAGLQLGLFLALQPEARAGWAPDGTVRELRFGEAQVRFTIADEAAKVDLNLASPELLDGLLLTAGVPPGVRLRLVDAVLDWRDPDGDSRPHGAEDAEYRAAGKSHGAKNGPFASVDELSLVLGMSPGLLATLAPALTVHSRQPLIVADSAQRQALLAIPGAQASEVDAYLAVRTANRAIGRDPPAIPETWRAYTSRNGSGTLGLHAQARLPGGATAHARAIVDLRRPGVGAPYSFLDWRHDGPELFAPAGP